MDKERVKALSEIARKTAQPLFVEEENMKIKKGKRDVLEKLEKKVREIYEDYDKLYEETKGKTTDGSDAYYQGISTGALTVLNMIDELKNEEGLFPNEEEKIHTILKPDFTIEVTSKKELLNEFYDLMNEARKSGNFHDFEAFNAIHNYIVNKDIGIPKGMKKSLYEEAYNHIFLNYSKRSEKFKDLKRFIILMKKEG